MQVSKWENSRNKQFGGRTKFRYKSKLSDAKSYLKPVINNFVGFKAFLMMVNWGGGGVFYQFEIKEHINHWDKGDKW